MRHQKLFGVFFFFFAAYHDFRFMYFHFYGSMLRDPCRHISSLPTTNLTRLQGRFSHATIKIWCKRVKNGWVAQPLHARWWLRSLQPWASPHQVLYQVAPGKGAENPILSSSQPFISLQFHHLLLFAFWSPPLSCFLPFSHLGIKKAILGKTCP